VSRRSQRPCGGITELAKVTEVHQGVGRDHDVEGLVSGAQKLSQLALLQIGVHVFPPGKAEHPGRQVDSDESRRVWPKQWPAQPGPAADVQSAFGGETGVGQRGDDEIRCAVCQALQLGLETGGEAVEGLLHERIRCTQGHVGAGAGSEHVLRDGFTWLVCEPFLEYLHGFVDFADHAVRQRKQPSGIQMPWAQGDRLAEALRGLPGAVQAVEQDTEVRVGVRMVGAQLDCGSVSSLGLLWPTGGAKQHAEIAVRVGVAGVDRNGAFVLGDRASSLPSD
jgi:hypothetical protein